MNRKTDIAIVSPVRTPIGRFGGSLAGLTAPELGAAAARATLERAGVDPTRVDWVVFGHARQAGAGPNPASPPGSRAGCLAGVEPHTPTSPPRGAPARRAP